MKIEQTEGTRTQFEATVERSQSIQHYKFETKNAIRSRLLEVILGVIRGTHRVFSLYTSLPTSSMTVVQSLAEILNTLNVNRER